MKIDIVIDATVHWHLHGEEQGLNAQILANTVTLLGKASTMSAQLDKLTAEVSRNTEVDQSAITLITGLAAQIESLKNDPVALQALADSMKSSSDSLAAAVAANTPAAPTGDPTP